MRQLPRLRRTEAENGSSEFADEVKVAEPLRISADRLIKHALDTEYAIVCRNPIDGMYVVPSASCLFEWYGIIFIRRGVFGGGIFRFNLFIPDDFPSTRHLPVVTLNMELFHPSIELKKRKLDMRRYFPDGWKRDKHHIFHILLVVQRIFFSLDCEAESCANPEAAILWKEHRDQFKEMTLDRVNQSRAQVYDEPTERDANAIRLTPWDASIHSSLRERIMLVSGGRGQDAIISSAGGATPWTTPGVAGKARGCSWIDTDRMTYMTEPISARSDYESIRAEQDRMVHGIEKLDLSSVISDESPQNSAKMSSTRSDIEIEGPDSSCDRAQENQKSDRTSEANELQKMKELSLETEDDEVSNV